ncbi:MAG TPA: hypothetical protein VK745_02380, partial [Polyangiaceae bacterium]|nr:hypothetical protein [Polyangiaceae bacterium]
ACDATVKKAGTCTTEGSVCSKTCGPGSSGYKSETCTAGAYVEGDCMFVPGGNYACYEKATPLPACSVATPTSSAACSDAPCMPCGPNYIDSTNTMKVGACVCANMKWSCASDTAWPPQ